MTAAELPSGATVCDGLATLQARTSRGPGAAIYTGHLTESHDPVLVTVVDEADDALLERFAPGTPLSSWPVATVRGVGRVDKAAVPSAGALVEERSALHTFDQWCDQEPIDVDDVAMAASRLCPLLLAYHHAGELLVELWPTRIFVAGRPVPIIEGMATRGADFLRAALGVPRAAGLMGVDAPAAPEVRAGGAATTASDVYTVAALLAMWVDGPRPEATKRYRPLAWERAREALAPALDDDPAARPIAARFARAISDACEVTHRVRARRPDDRSRLVPRDPVEKSIDQPPDGWVPGDIVERVYRVEPVVEGGRERAAHESGGMGLVYRMHHLAWQSDVAVKVPRPEFFRTEEHRTAFEAEVDTWVRLGLHPHVVDCHYLRRIGGLPCVFSEYRAGGTLANLIGSGEIYADRNGSLRTVLDLGIQTAWGLAHAHRSGVVHQDVKPGNVLLDGARTAQVSDFGLAQAFSRAAPDATTRVGDDVPADKTLIVPGAGGMTPAYASPEQFARAPLTPATDVWSWALMVLELLLGGRRWVIGPAARDALASLAETAAVATPVRVIEVLEQCLDPDPGRRPRDLMAVAASLQEVWEAEERAAFPRAVPEAASALADGLSNEGLSMLDLGRVADAEERWQRALAADGRHAPTTFNRGLHQWRSGTITDVELVGRMEDLARSHEDDWLDEFLLGLVHSERGDEWSARRCFADIEAQASGDQMFQDAKDALEADPSPTGLRHRVVGDIRVVRSVALTRGDEFAVAGGWGGVEIWHVSSGLRVASLDRADDGGRVDVRAAALTTMYHGLLVAYAGDLPGGTRIEIAKVDIRRFRAALGTAHRPRSGGRSPGIGRHWRPFRTVFPSSPVDSLEFDVDGSGLWITTNGQRLRYDIERCAITDTEVAPEPKPPTGLPRPADGRPYRAIATDEAAKIAVTADVQGLTRLWDLGEARCLRTFSEHEPRVRAVAVARTGDLAITGDDHGFVAVWQLADPEHRVRVPWFYSRPRAASDVGAAAAKVRRALAESDHLLDAGDARGAAAVIAAARAEPGWQRDPSLVRASQRAGRHGRRGNLVDAWVSDVRSAPVQHALEVAMPGFVATGVPVNALAASRDGSVVVVARSASIQVWSDDIEAPRTMSLPPAPAQQVRADDSGVLMHVQEIGSLCVSADGRLALSAAPRGPIRVWDVDAGVQRSLLGANGAHSVAVNGAGTLAVSAGWRPEIEVWDVSSGTSLGTMRGEGVVGALAFAPDARLCVTASGRHVTVWDLDARSTRPLEPCAAPARTLAITPDGRFCAVGLEGGAVESFHVQAGRRISTLKPPVGETTSTAPDVTLSEDGRVVVASHRGSLVVWSVVGDGQRRLPVPGSGTSSRPAPVVITADATAVLAGSPDGSLVRWSLDWSYDFEQES